MPAAATGGGKKKKEPRKPQPVYTAPSARESAGTKKAVQQFNKDTGRKVFRTTKSRKKATVVVSGNYKGVTASAVTVQSANPNLLKDRIKINKVYKGSKDRPGFAVPKVTEHELGHAVGLEHREGKKNLMNTYVRDDKVKPGQKAKIRKKGYAKTESKRRGPTKRK
jgi:hypothetical protein